MPAKKTSKKRAQGHAARSRQPAATAKSGATSRADARFAKTRADHASELAEDYVELINQQIREHGEARTVDIARALGVSHVTVAKTILRLQREGLVTTAPYRSIFLTDKGEALAQWSEERHALVVALLRKLGVNARDAERDAEGIEHHLSTATIAAIRRFVREA